MYYRENYKKIGDKKAIVYSNMYLNNMHLNCKYTNQREVEELCPSYLRGTINVPTLFLDAVKEVLN